MSDTNNGFKTEFQTFSPDEDCELVITSKVKPDGRTVYSFAMFRLYEHAESGEEKRGPWFSARHINQLRALLDVADQEIRDMIADQRVADREVSRGR